jgi:hypothetical protein
LLHNTCFTVARPTKPQLNPESEGLAMFPSLLLLTLLAAPPAAPGTTMDTTTTDIATELHHINESLRVLVQSATAQASRSRLDLMLRRAELTAQELAPINSELRSLRQTIDFTDDDLKNQVSELSGMDEKLADPAFPDKDAKLVEEGARVLRRTIEVEQRRVKRLTDRQSILETEAAAKTAEIDQVKAALDRALFATNP